MSDRQEMREGSCSRCDDVVPGASDSQDRHKLGSLAARSRYSSSTTFKKSHPLLEDVLAENISVGGIPPRKNCERTSVGFPIRE
jgi:hypothetical protein